MKSKANQPPAKSDLDAEALKCLPGVEDFLRAIGVKSNDSSFSALYQRVADFTKSVPSLFKVQPSLTSSSSAFWRLYA